MRIDNIHEYVTAVTEFRDPEIERIKSYGEKIREINAELVSVTLRGQRNIKSIVCKNGMRFDVTAQLHSYSGTTAFKRLVREEIAKAIKDAMPAELILSLSEIGKLSATVSGSKVNSPFKSEIDFATDSESLNEKCIACLAIDIASIIKAAQVINDKSALFMMGVKCSDDWKAIKNLTAANIAQELGSKIIYRVQLEKIADKLSNLVELEWRISKIKNNSHRNKDQMEAKLDSLIDAKNKKAAEIRGDLTLMITGASK